MLRLYYGGAENPHWANLLADNGVSTMGLSYIGLSRRIKFSRPWLVSRHFPETASVFLDSGAYTLNTHPGDYTRDEALELAHGYMSFAEANADDVDMISEFDAQILGRGYIAQMRDDFYNDFGDKFLPIWHSEYGTSDLEQLASRYERVGVLQADLNADLSPLLNGLVSRFGVKLHGVAMTRMESMKEVRWDSVGSTSWLSPSKYGDTILWEPASKTLHRYPKKYKDEKRKLHRSMLASAGFNVQAVEADDTDELLRVSIWSWQQYVGHINKTSVTNQPRSESSGIAETTPDGVANPENPAQNQQLTTIRETKPFPGLGFRAGKSRTTNSEGEEELVDEVQVFRRSDSARVCDNCFLKDKCPEFLPGANCAYGFPLTLETPSQIAALEDMIITMQAQRVVFMQMVEEREGGYADANLSGEIDRLSRLIKARRESEKEGFTLHIEGSQNKGSSMFAQMFGNQVAEQAQPHFPAVSADEFIKDAGIIDAEAVDEE